MLIPLSPSATSTRYALRTSVPGTNAPTASCTVAPQILHATTPAPMVLQPSPVCATGPEMDHHHVNVIQHALQTSKQRTSILCRRLKRPEPSRTRRTPARDIVSTPSQSRNRSRKYSSRIQHPGHIPDTSAITNLNLLSLYDASLRKSACILR